MRKLLIVAGLAAGAFIVWKKLTATSEMEEFADEMYDTAPPQQQEQPAGAPV